ncbi:MAG: hypothetical protein R3B13_02325 [Polyangiaceae bacterium]
MRGHQAARQFHDYTQRTLQVAGQFEVLSRHVQGIERRTSEELDAVALELANAYLPGLTRHHLDALERLTGFLAFQRRDPLEAMAHERHVLEHTIATIRADGRYDKREELAGPHGTLRTRLTQAHEMMAPWVTDCARYESLEGFTDLVYSAYDTPEFRHNWWQGEYWRRWKQGDAICEALGMKDFGDDVLPAYRKSAEQRAFWQQEIRGLESELASITELVQRHDESVSRLQNLARIYLEQCQKLLGEHLIQSDVKLLSEWLIQSGHDNRAVQMSLRKLSGMRAKRDFLRQLHTHGVAATVDALKDRAKKFERKAQKFLRPKHQSRNVGPQELESGLPNKLGKLQERTKKLRALVDRIGGYDQYERFSLDNDPYLWWWEQTGGKVPPSIMGTLHRYYQQNPSARPVIEKDGRRAVAQAAAQAHEREEDLVGLS